ncbi:cation transporter [Candidatus Woesearchaeota archaeon]|nr:cation transporter [Candidatus Woesearchaeota archaeon]
METKLKIKGTHCNSCKILIEDVCSEFPEIKSSNMDLKKEELTIIHDKKVDVKKLKKEIESLGDYKVE